jgi:hypothetical protein
MQPAALASRPQIPTARSTMPTAPSLAMTPPAHRETGPNDNNSLPAWSGDRSVAHAPAKQPAVRRPLLPAAFADRAPTAPPLLSVVLPAVERTSAHADDLTTNAGPFATSPAAPDRSAEAPLASAMAPPAREQEGGASEGDVYLDGTRIGRWMVDTLSRQAARPPAGRAAFDPRLGLAWPGTQQGN